MTQSAYSNNNASTTNNSKYNREPIMSTRNNNSSKEKIMPTQIQKVIKSISGAIFVVTTLVVMSTNALADGSVGVSINIDPLAIGNAIADAVKNNAGRGAFTDNLVETVFYQAGQKYNVLAVNMNQHPQTGGLKDVVFYGSATAPDGTLYGVWAFKSGEFTHDGDGGWINWAMKGWFTRDGDGGKHVVFQPSF